MARLLAFVDIFVESPEMDNVVAALSKLENLEELFEVTGEFDLVTLFSASDIEELRDILKNRVMKIKGVKSTVSSIVSRACQRKSPLSAHLRPTNASAFRHSTLRAV